MKKKTKLKIIFFLCLPVCIALFLLYYQGNKKEKGEVLQYFYSNSCASCQGDKEFLEDYKGLLPQSKKAKIKVVTWNIFQEANRQYYEKELKKNQLPLKTEFPCVIYRGSYLSGQDNIKENLEKFIKYPENFKKKEEESKETLEGIKGREIKKELANEIKNQEKITALLFTTRACDSCERVKEDIKGLNKKNDIHLIEVDITKENRVSILRSFFENYKVVSKEQKVPILFIGGNYERESGRIEKLWREKIKIKDKNHIFSENEHLIQTVLSESFEEEKNPLKSKISIMLAGLLAGFNPCAISMFFLLLSLVMVEKAKVFLSGFVYLLGKYMAYFLIGMGIYAGISFINGKGLRSIQEISFRVLGILFCVLGLFYMRDVYILLVKKAGQIRTQLPKRLRRFNQNLIKRVYEGAGKNYKLLLLFALGMAISLGEFFCTGQIYMASIVYLLELGQSGVWMYFFIYVTAMSLPSFVFLLFLQRTRNMDKIAIFMAKNLGFIKIVSGILFFIYGLYFFLR